MTDGDNASFLLVVSIESTGMLACYRKEARKAKTDRVFATFLEKQSGG